LAEQTFSDENASTVQAALPSKESEGATPMISPEDEFKMAADTAENTGYEIALLLTSKPRNEIGDLAKDLALIITDRAASTSGQKFSATQALGAALFTLADWVLQARDGVPRTPEETDAMRQQITFGMLERDITDSTEEEDNEN
jgi:hypothetical protein